MSELKYTTRAAELLNDAVECCKNYRHEFVTPEHVLLALLDNDTFLTTLDEYLPQYDMAHHLEEYLKSEETVPESLTYEPELSVQFSQMLEMAYQQVINSSATDIDITHIVRSMLQLKESLAAYLLKDALEEQTEDFMSALISAYEMDDEHEDENERVRNEAWRKFVVCLNETYQQHNPLIGREAELQRTIQVLCRKEKNNPLHVGEPGVGKTALIYGLAHRIEQHQVPKRLEQSKIYLLDLGTLLAGTQYRGDFENRLKQIMEGIAAESSNNIVYIDEIHNLVGTGAIGESSMDASNMLKPYLEGGTIRFIGSTTYEEYNKYFSRSKGLVRRFQQIDILEPSVDETIHILKQLRPKFEEFHGVVYEDAALELAVTASAHHITDRFLPDKAIDLMDEAGAALEMSAQEGMKVVGKQQITEVLAKTCKVESMAVKEDDTERLAVLQTQLLKQIYGQDEAVRQVTEAILLSKAGLTDDNKPLAALLFVGPTGVGKTEVARVLAQELGIELVRFDMSEYTEKHTVAKLIGSPAGYVGYEDGGLLTDAIRRAPNCVLLLDEIEKAHSDIYNILLQVMDYARLTDNKGRKADFRNVVLIMTSNAGAQYAGMASVGFSGNVSKGEAMLREVKKTFKPEFTNRLSGTVVFHDMDRTMATLILRKKLRLLEEKLNAKHVMMTLSYTAFEVLLNEGFTREYGAREIDRVIARRLKPLLMREILFGCLKDGGHAVIDADKNKELHIQKS